MQLNLTSNMSLTSVIVLNSSNSSSLVGYDEKVESFYLTFLDIGTWLAIIVQLFFYRFVFLSTPKNMFNYKITVSNTSTWCLLMTIFFGVLLRPVPLFPIPAAKVTGPLKNFGEFWGAQYAWIFAVLCTSNFISAAMNCFVVLAIFLLEPRGFFGRLSRGQGICLGMFNHLLTSTAVVLFMTVVYTPVTDLKEKLLSRYPAELSPVLSPNDTIVFGYDPAHGPNLMAAFVLILFLVQGNICNTLYALLVRKIWVQIKKSSARETARNRRNVILMLTARMTFPTLFGFLPLMIICACLWFEVRNAFAFYCALSAIPIIHGLFNVLATILAFRPYRQASVQLFFCVLYIFGINSANLHSVGTVQSMYNNGKQPTTGHNRTIGKTVTHQLNNTVLPQREGRQISSYK